MANRTFLKNLGGALTEERTVEVSAGAGDAGKIPNVNASGVLDATVMNAKNSSAGAADAGKVPLLDASGVLASSIVNSVATSAGAADAAKLVALDGTGRLDSTFLPVGVGAETVTVTTSEALSAGDVVNLHNSGGLRARKADASNGRMAHGFVLSAFASSASASVYLEGTNTQVSARTPGEVQYLSATTAGAVTETAPTTAGQIVQRIGIATGTTQFTFEAEQPITLA
jgi:hypothetical protein